jgi:hypothetical protein
MCCEVKKYGYLKFFLYCLPVLLVMKLFVEKLKTVVKNLIGIGIWTPVTPTFFYDKSKSEVEGF